MTVQEHPVMSLLSLYIQRPGTNKFVLGQSALGTNSPRLAGPTDAYTRHDIIGQAVQSMQITRQLGEVGTLTVTLKDTTLSWITPGQTIECWLTGLGGLFTGIIRSHSTEHADGHAYTTIVATDIMTELSNQTRYGASTGDDQATESVSDRIRRILASVPDLPAVTSSMLLAGPQVCNTVYESSVANHLALACDSSTSHRWHIDRYGRIVVATTYTPNVNFHPAINDPATLAYSRIDYGEDTAQVVNEATLTNHRRVLNEEDNTWNADDQTHTYIDPTSRATWGAGTASVDVSLDNQTDLDTLGASILNRFKDPARLPRSVTVNAQTNPFLIVNTDLNHHAYVAFPDMTSGHGAIIASISHEITHTRWMTTYTFEKD